MACVGWAVLVGRLHLNTSEAWEGQRWMLFLLFHFILFCSLTSSWARHWKMLLFRAFPGEPGKPCPSSLPHLPWLPIALGVKCKVLTVTQICPLFTSQPSSPLSLRLTHFYSSHTGLLTVPRTTRYNLT